MVRLTLNNNNIGDKGATSIAEAIRASGSLTLMICLESNNIGADAKQSLRDAVKGLGVHLSM